MELCSPGLRTKHNRSTAGTPQSRPERATSGPTTSLLAARGERGAQGLWAGAKARPPSPLPPRAQRPESGVPHRAPSRAALTADRAASRAGRSALAARAGREGSGEAGRAGGGDVSGRGLRERARWGGVWEGRGDSLRGRRGGDEAAT